MIVNIVNCDSRGQFEHLVRLCRSQFHGHFGWGGDYTIRLERFFCERMKLSADFPLRLSEVTLCCVNTRLVRFGATDPVSDILLKRDPISDRGWQSRTERGLDCIWKTMPMWCFMWAAFQKCTSRHSWLGVQMDHVPGFLRNLAPGKNVLWTFGREIFQAKKTPHTVLQMTGCNLSFFQYRFC